MDEGCVSEYSLEEIRAKKKPNQYFIEDKTEQQGHVFKRKRDERKFRGTKTRRTKDREEELGGME